MRPPPRTPSETRRSRLTTTARMSSILMKADFDKSRVGRGGGYWLYVCFFSCGCVLGSFQESCCVCFLWLQDVTSGGVVADRVVGGGGFLSCLAFVPSNT